MSNDEAKKLCLDLMLADTERQVIDVLTKAGYWNDEAAWRLFGDEENNYSVIGSQQSSAEAALVEKLTNSMDARLIGACLRSGIDPRGSDSPKSVSEAVGTFFAGARKESSGLGLIGEWGDQKQTENAERGIALAATGQLSPHKPSLTISDSGEGQTPERMPHTLLSLTKTNKLGIRFVQGQHNMGGTGVLRFCGKNNLQLVLSRRDPKLTSSGSVDDHMWSFTIVRRINPTGSKRSSTYVYLAPRGSVSNPGVGGVLRFNAQTMPIFHKGSSAYAVESDHGTLIKLYEYQYPQAYNNILRTRPSLLNRLEILLPQAALPVRVFECRKKGGESHEGSYATNLVGVVHRLSAERSDEKNPLDLKPIKASIDVEGEPFFVTIYALKRPKSKDSHSSYRRSEGVLFTLNGQTQGILRDDFFIRKKVKMGYLRDSLLVVVDASTISGRAREELFMNSRDRLADGPLATAVVSALEDVVGKNEQLRELQHRRQQELLNDKLKDDKPLQDVLKTLIAKSPSLSQFFHFGDKVVNPFATQQVKGDPKPYEGRYTPTYFRFKGRDAGQRLMRQCPINRRVRIDIETDAQNDYFDRSLDAGELCILLTGASGLAACTMTKTLSDGMMHLTIKLPETIEVGDRFELVIEVIDPSLSETFLNLAELTVIEAATLSSGGGTKRKPNSKDKGQDQAAPMGVAIPNIEEVEESKWDAMAPPFDRFTAMRVVDESNAEEEQEDRPPMFRYFANIDNVFLKTEMKGSRSDPQVLKARFKIGMWLVALALTRQDVERSRKAREGETNLEDASEPPPLVDIIHSTTDAMAPVLLPMISMLGALDEASLDAAVEEETYGEQDELGG